MPDSPIAFETSPQTIGAPDSITTKPSFGLTMANTLYKNTDQSLTANALGYVDALGINPDRPKLPQDQVNQIWQSNGLKGSPPNATNFSDVGIYYLLDRAKRNQEAENIDAATPINIGTPIRAATNLALGFTQPENLAVSMFPLAKVFQAMRFTPGIAGLDALSNIAENSTSAIARTVASTTTGALEGTAAMLPIEAANAALSSKDGQDYSATQAMKDIGFGAMFGGLLHGAGAALGNVSKFRNKQLPEENIADTTGLDQSTLSPQNQQATPIQPQGVSDVQQPTTPNLPDIGNISKLTTDENGLVNIQDNEPKFANYLSKMDDTELPYHLDQDGNLNEYGANNIRQQVIAKSLGDDEHPIFDMANTGDVQANDMANSLLRSSSIINDARTNDDVDFNKLDISNDITDVLQENKTGIVNDTSDTEAKNIISDKINNISNPRQLTDFISNYYKEINEHPEMSKVEALQSSFNRPSSTPTNKTVSDTFKTLQDLYQNNNSARNMIFRARPQTRENAFRQGLDQVSKDQYANVDSIIKSDPVNNMAIQDDVIRDQQNNSTNTPLYNDTTDAVTPDTGIRYSDRFVNPEDYKSETNIINRKISDIEELSNRGLYSRSDNVSSETLSKQDVSDHVQDIFGDDGSKLLSSGKLKIVDEVSNLPGKHPDNTIGVFFNKKGEAYIVANNVERSAIKGIVLHELGVHGSLQNFVGKELYANVLDQVDRLLDRDSALNDVVNAAIPNDTLPENVREEKLAYMVQEMADIPPVQSLLSKIRTWLYKTFPSLKNKIELTPTDLQQLAMSSLRKYARSKQRNITDIEGTAYSLSQDDIQRAQNEIDIVNNELGRIEQYRTDLYNAPEIFDNLSSKKSFTEALQNKISYLTKEEASDLYEDVSKSYERYKQNGDANPEQKSIDYALNKYEHGITAYKYALVHDQYIQPKITNYLKDNWSGKGFNGLQSLTIGTALKRTNSRSFVTADIIRNTRNMYNGLLTNELERSGLYDAWKKGIYDDDTIRAMERLEAVTDVSTLPKEAVTLAKITQDIYDRQLTEMRDNGLVINKTRNYFANQRYAHDQQKITKLGEEQWIDLANKTFDFSAMADAMNVNVSDIPNLLRSKINDDGTISGIYHGLSTGEHIGSSGNVAGTTYTGGLRRVGVQPRKIIFKNADAFIQYRDLCGTKGFSSAVLGTIESSSNKLGIIKNLGVNYEKNLTRIANDFISSEPLPEVRQQLRSKMPAIFRQLKVVDGRIDRVESQAIARFTSSVLAIRNIGLSGFFGIAALNDLSTQAGFLTKNGMGHGIVSNLLDQTSRYFKGYSDDQKQILGSIISYADGHLRDVHRYGQQDDTLPGVLARLQNISGKWSQVERVTQANKLNAMDSLMQFTAGFANKDFNDLNTGFKSTLNTHGIGEEEWNLLRQMPLKQADGKNYMVGENLQDIRDKIQDQVKSNIPDATGSQLDLLTTRYSNDLSNKLRNYYMDGLSRMVIEPDAFTKYTASLNGQVVRGTMTDMFTRFFMMFKTFSFGYVNKVLGDYMYNDADTVMRNLAAGDKQALYNKMNFAKYIAGSALVGMATNAIRDTLSLKQPQPLWLPNNQGVQKLNWSSMLRGLTAGGGLGIYGDYFLGSFSRFGKTPLETAAGPVYGSLSDAFTALSQVRQGDFKGARSTGINLAVSNAPFINTLYTRAAFNYLILYSLQEYLNPGYLQRMENRVNTQNNQEFIISPTTAPRW